MQERARQQKEEEMAALGFHLRPAKTDAEGAPGSSPLMSELATRAMEAAAAAMEALRRARREHAESQQWQQQGGAAVPPAATASFSREAVGLFYDPLGEGSGPGGVQTTIGRT